MKKVQIKNRFDKGLGLVPILIAIASVLGVTTFFLDSIKNISQVKQVSSRVSDQEKLNRLVRMILGDSNFCIANLGGREFRKRDVDSLTSSSTFTLTTLSLTDQAGNSTVTKVSTVNATLRTFGSIKVDALTFYLINNKDVKSSGDYLTSSRHHDVGIFRVSASRTVGNITTPLVLDYPVFVVMSTTSSGRTTITECQSSLASKPYPYPVGCENASSWYCSCAEKETGPSRSRIVSCLHCNSNWVVDDIWIGNMYIGGIPFFGGTYQTDCPSISSIQGQLSSINSDPVVSSKYYQFKRDD